MDQHPIPRNVTGFEFQLVGFMTLKQFFYLLFGAGFFLIFWKSPLGIFRYPLSFFSGFLAIAFAFIPVQERPLEVWIKNFLISIYSPTEYVWQKEGNLPAYFTNTSISKNKNINKKEIEKLSTEAQNKLQAYLSSIQQTEDKKLENEENKLLSHISTYIKSPKTIPSSFPSKKIKKLPNIQPLPLGIIKGKVMDQNKPLSHIIINVLDANNKTVRVVSTNSNGEFMTKIPLPMGKYKLITEDPEKKHQFKTYMFTVGNIPLKPWLISPIYAIN